MAPPLPGLRLNLPPIPDDDARYERADLEASRDVGDDTFSETSTVANQDSFDFAPVFDPVWEEPGAGGLQLTETRGMREKRRDLTFDDDNESSVRPEISHVSQAVVPPDHSLRQALARPRLAAVSVAAILMTEDTEENQPWSLAKSTPVDQDGVRTGNDDRDDVSSSSQATDVPTKKQQHVVLPDALLENRDDRDPRRAKRRVPRLARIVKNSWAYDGLDDDNQDDNRLGRFVDAWRVPVVTDDTNPEQDFVPSATHGNARWTEAAAQLMTPALGEALIEEEESNAVKDDTEVLEEVKDDEEVLNDEMSDGVSKVRKVGPSQRYLTSTEITEYYKARLAKFLKKTNAPPSRNRSPKATWNGDRPGLCRLAAKVEEGGSKKQSQQVGKQHECFLSRTYTEGFCSPVAFAAYPSNDILCKACGDVAWDPVRYPKREVLNSELDNSNLWCRDCLHVNGVLSGEKVKDLETDENVVTRISLKRVLCRHVLVCERIEVEGEDVDAQELGSDVESVSDVESEQSAESGSVRSISVRSSRASKKSRKPKQPKFELRWTMDSVANGCTDSGRLCDRVTLERDCSRAIIVCGLPEGDSNPRDVCDLRVRSGDFQAHKSECNFRLVTCSRADQGCCQKIRAKHEKAHWRLCEHRPFACPNRPRCSWRGMRKEVDSHLQKKCAWEVVPCGLVDDDPDGLIGKRQIQKDQLIGTDGRVYSFGGDSIHEHDEYDVNRSKRNSLRSKSKGQGLGLIQNGGETKSRRQKISSFASASSYESFATLASSSKMKRGSKHLEKVERGEQCEVRLTRCKLTAHRAVCRFQRVKCRHCGAPRALRRMGQHEAECEERNKPCEKCGQTIPTDQKELHLRSICPEVDVVCAFARYGCLTPVVSRREYSEHANKCLHLHLNLLLTYDKNAPPPEKTAEGDPYPDLSLFAETGEKDIQSASSNASNASKTAVDGFSSLVTRHELTRADLFKVKTVALAASSGAITEVDHAIEQVRHADTKRADAFKLVRLEMQTAKDAFTKECAQAISKSNACDEKTEKIISKTLSESNATRKEIEHTSADRDAFDAITKEVTNRVSAIEHTATNYSRDLGSTLTKLLAVVAPHLTLLPTMEAKVAEETTGLHSRLANLEWAAADRSIVLWEKIEDAREEFAGKIVPREIAHRALCQKVSALEENEFINAKEDQAIRTRAKDLRIFIPEEEPSSDLIAPSTPRGAGEEQREAL